MSPTNPFDKQPHTPKKISTGGLDQAEAQVPRLGDYLIEKGLLTTEQLNQALRQQKQAAHKGTGSLLGRVLIEQGMIDQRVLEDVVIEQILALQTALKEANAQLEKKVEERTLDLQRRAVQIQTAAEVAQSAISATNLQELLSTTVNLIVERFGYYYASIFLIDDTGQNAVLREATGRIGKELINRSYRLPVGSRSVVGWVTLNNMHRIVSETSSDPLFLQDELLPQTRSEACVPLAVGSHVMGALDVQSTSANAFSEPDLAVLQTLANQIASGIQNLRMLEATRINLDEMSLLFKASQQIGQAETVDEVLRHTASALHRTPHVSALLLAEKSGLKIVSLNDPESHAATQPLINRQLSLQADEIARSFTSAQPYLIMKQDEQNNLPAELAEIQQRLGCKQIALLPTWRQKKLFGLIMLGSRQPNQFNSISVQPYANLAEFTSTALEKNYALNSTEASLKRLEVLNQVSQTIAAETSDLERLYQTIHEQIREVLGETVFYIALYNHHTNYISFPYLYEDGQRTNLPPIPLGEGLTSVVIRRKEPLMLLEDTARRAEELGAKRVGKIAKSWLGAPLLIGDTVIGIICVQHTELENFFSEDDLQFITTLASQIAVALRNANLIESARQKAERERTLFEVTEKIRNSVDMQTILQTTAKELSRALGARRAHVKITVDHLQTGKFEVPSDLGGNGKEGHQ